MEVIYMKEVHNLIYDNKHWVHQVVEKRWDIESESEMVDMIQTASETFSDKQVLMSSSDSLIYIFDDVKEAIDFINFRVKKIDFVSTFEYARIGNVNSKNMYLYIKTDVESYTIKTLDSYRYEI